MARTLSVYSVRATQMAVVFPNKSLNENFAYIVRANGEASEQDRLSEDEIVAQIMYVHLDVHFWTHVLAPADEDCLLY